MPVNTSNPLYQNIQQTAESVKQVYANQPTFESSMQSGIVGGDATLNSTLNNYTDKVAELFAHDKNVSTNYIKPEDSAFGALPEGMVLDPSSKWETDNELYAQKGKEATSALNLYEKRKNFLGDLVDKAVKMYEAGVKGKELDYKNAQDEFDNALQTATLAETKRSNLANEKAKLKIGGTGVDVIDEKTEAEVQRDFEKRFGSVAYKGLSATIGERNNAARNILAQLETGNDVDVRSLMTEAERKDWDAADTLLVTADTAARIFAGKSGAGGTGLLAGLIPDKYASTKIRILRSAISDVAPAKIKELSGVAVSDREFERLTSLLPQNNLSEEENYRRIQIMANRIRANKDIRSAMKLENLTASKAIEKYGDAIFTKYGFDQAGNNPDKSGGTWETIGEEEE